MGQRGPGAGESGIALDGLLEDRGGRPDVDVGPLVEQVLSPEVEIVGIGCRRGPRRRTPARPAGSETRLDGVGDFAGYLVLQRQQAAQLPVVLVGPEPCVVPGPHQLGGHPNPARVPPHAAQKQVLGAQLAPDPLRRILSVLEVHHRRPGDHAEPGGVAAPHLGDHLLGKAVAEVLLPLVAGEILKRQDRQHDPGRGAVRLPVTRPDDGGKDERQGQGGHEPQGGARSGACWGWFLERPARLRAPWTADRSDRGSVQQSDTLGR